MVAEQKHAAMGVGEWADGTAAVCGGVDSCTPVEQEQYQPWVDQ